MNIKQFKKRWLMSKIEPELFYMPVGKNENIKYGNLYIRVKSYNLYNIDTGLFEGEVSNLRCEIVIKDVNGNIVYLNKNGKGQSLPSLSAFYSLPYGKYYIKIIRIEGYELDNKFHEIELNSNYAFLNIILDWQICINTVTSTINSSPYYGYTNVVNRNTYPNFNFLREKPIVSTYSDNCKTTNLHGNLIAEINNYTDYERCGYNIRQTFSGAYNFTNLTVSFIGNRFNRLQISPTTTNTTYNYQIIDKGFFVGVNKETPRPSTGIMLNHISSVADIYQGYEYNSAAQFSYVYEMTDNTNTFKWYLIVPITYNVYTVLNSIAILNANNGFYDKNNIDINWFLRGNKLIAEGLQEEIIDNMKHTYYYRDYSPIVDSFVEDDSYNKIKLMPNIEYMNDSFIAGLAESYKIHNSSTSYLHKRRNYILNGINVSNTSVVTQENQYLVFTNAITYSDDYDQY